MAVDCIEQHSIEIFDRGGTHRLGEFIDITSVSYNRVRDDTSGASFGIAARNCSKQEKTINDFMPGRHEIVIWRNNERMWEGPGNLRGDGAGGIQVSAKDVSYYGQRLIMKSTYDYTYPNNGPVTQLATQVLTTELGRRETESPPINVVPFITRHVTPDEAGYANKTVPYSAYVTDFLKTLAQDRGIDFVVVGRAIHIWDTSYGLGQTPKLTENDFRGQLLVSTYGAELATYTAATDGQGNFGEDGGVDPYYGLWERLNTVYDATTATTTAPSVADMTDQAVRDRAGRNPTPTQVRIPDNSSINPNGALKMSDLVPGNLVPLSLMVGIREINQLQKLKSVNFAETADGENITVVLYPASGQDFVGDD